MNETVEMPKIPHYYGDAVRMLFMIAAIVMFVTLPMFNQDIGLPVVFSAVAILILGTAAGLTNPKLIWDAGINAAIAVAGFLVFVIYSVNSYGEGGVENFFLTNLTLGFIFLLAIYFSVKTFRGLILQKRYGSQ